jgi:gluconolactonase
LNLISTRDGSEPGHVPYRPYRGCLTPACEGGCLVNAFEALGRGLGFVEGPVWTGRSLVITSITQGVLYELGLDGSAPQVYATPGGGPNGLARSADGTVWAAQGGGGHFDMEYVSKRPPGLLRIPAGGSVEYVVEQAVTAPSDCAFGADGRLYFTDAPHTFDARNPGQVVAYDPGSGAAVKLTTDEHYPEGFYPNGIAFGPDAGVLYVADTMNRRVLQYDVVEGALSAPRLFSPCRGFPDGLAVDVDGNVYVALLTKDVIAIHAPSGELLDRIEVPGSGPTNVCFAGAGLETMVVTASKMECVLVASAPARGLPLHSPQVPVKG